MPLIKISELHDIAEQNLQSFASIFDETKIEKTASKKLTESYDNFSVENTYHIFLSHSYLDAKSVYGLKEILEYEGLTVFVDWLDPKYYDRENVDANRAGELRDQMKNCDSLLFAVSDNSSTSKWMPWELGYFDGYKDKVAIIPLNKNYRDIAFFDGQEYLGIYPYVQKYKNSLKIFSPDHKEIDNLINWI